MDGYIERERLHYGVPVNERHLQGEENHVDSSKMDYYDRLDVGYDESRSRPLNQGDLVNVLEGKDGSKRRSSGLGRIIRIIETNGRTIKYDIDFLLGGKALGLQRHEMLYTTAEKEGLTTSTTSNNRASSRSSTKRRISLEETEREEDFDDRQEVARKLKIKLNKIKKPQDMTSYDTAHNTTMISNEDTTRKKKKSLPLKKSSQSEKKDARKSPSPTMECTNIKKPKTETSKKSKHDDNSYKIDYNRFQEHQTGLERFLDKLEKVDRYDYFTGDFIPPMLDDMLEDDTIDMTIPPFNFKALWRRVKEGRYIFDRHKVEVKRLMDIAKSRGLDDCNIENVKIAHPKGIDWKLLKEDITAMTDAAISRDPGGKTSRAGTLGHTSRKIQDTMDTMGGKVAFKQYIEMMSDDIHLRIDHKLDMNKEAAVQGEYRKPEFPERRYERITTSDILCAGLSPLDQASAKYELETNLPDSFVGLPYNCDDMGQSEEWMKSATKLMTADEDDTVKALTSNERVIKAQVQSVMDTILLSVQDRAMTEMNILSKPELISSREIRDSLWGDFLSPEDADAAEQPVFGIDSYTRKNIVLCLEDEFGEECVIEFIEKWLLPAINACPVSMGHDITCAARIIQGLPPAAELFSPQDTTTSNEDESIPLTELGIAYAKKLSSEAPAWLKYAAKQLYDSAFALGARAFLIHPKGHGAVVLHRMGLPPNKIVTHYRGEVYPAWRWGEKMDAIEETQVKLGLRPALPDFYNMALERPRLDPRGYGLLFVDASRKAGFGSSFSHSCDPTCEVRVAAVNGKLVLAMTTVREVVCGEELTFDYNAVTESLNEYQSAVCLCGFSKCRSSFLHFATADCYQQVMARNSPICIRFAYLLKSMAKKVMSNEDNVLLKRHGFATAAFGPVSFVKGEDRIDHVPIWLRTYVADILRYIEYERRAMPVALLHNHLSKLNEKSASDSKKRVKRRGGVDQVVGGGKVKKVKAEESQANASTDKVKRKKSLDHKQDKKLKNENKSQMKQSLICTESIEKQDEDSSVASSNQIPKPDKPVSQTFIKGSRPPPAFVYFSKMEKEKYLLLWREQQEDDDDTSDSKKHKFQKFVACEWKKLPQETKKYWKEEAYKEWVESGGKEKERMEQERKKRLKTEARQQQQQQTVFFDQEDHRKEAEEKEKLQRKEKLQQALKRKQLKKREAARKAKLEINQQLNSQDQEVEEEKKVEKPVVEPTPSYEQSEVMDENVQSDEVGDSIEVTNPILPTVSQSISYSAADAEGRACMEQRIQSLTQALSRVGRVLSRHREDSLSETPIHAPLLVMTDDQVIQWMWKKPNGIIPIMMSSVRSTFPAISKDVKVIERRYNDYVSNKTECPKNMNLRQSLMLDLRECFMNAFKMKETEYKLKISNAASNKNTQVKEKLTAATSFDTQALKQSAPQASSNKALADDDKTAPSPTNIERIKNNDTPDQVVSKDNTFPCVRTVSDDSVDKSNEQSNVIVNDKKSTNDVISKNILAPKTTTSNDTSHKKTVKVTWKQFSYQKWKLEAAADLCLFYAYTDTFFQINPYKEIESTPIEVYARELGNSVPRSVVDEDSGKSDKPKKKYKAKDCCQPEDVVATITRKYSNEYVLSQLLQWYNGGIGTKPGLPEMQGCIILPPITACWEEKELGGTNKKASKAVIHNDNYNTEIRKKMIDWIDNRYTRGSPWPDRVNQFFNRGQPQDSFVFGSPILDFLVTGDDSNIVNVLYALKQENGGSSSFDPRHRGKSTAADQMQLTVDEGLPAQAVANWVQCENPNCLKWRKLPWHVDVDLLPPQFFCKDNLWNKNSNSCDSPEDAWDELDVKCS